MQYLFQFLPNHMNTHQHAYIMKGATLCRIIAISVGTCEKAKPENTVHVLNDYAWRNSATVMLKLLQANLIYWLTLLCQVLPIIYCHLNFLSIINPQYTHQTVQII